MATTVNTAGWPLAYLITFSCYGTWLHGDDRGSVDREHNEVGADLVPANDVRLAAESERMRQAPYRLDEPRRNVVLRAIIDIAEKRGWHLLAAHVRSNHVHVVVSAGRSP